MANEANFEWDKAKANANLKKHGVDFVRASKIFSGPIFEAINGRDYSGEQRIMAIGEADGLYVVVIYTWRGVARRLISAWKAGKNDREKYKKSLADRYGQAARPDKS